VRAGDKAAVLAESLPYIRRFWGKVVVVKYGGSAIGEGDALALFAQDVAHMRSWPGWARWPSSATGSG
jgi:acetylglutamate kinase